MLFTKSYIIPFTNGINSGSSNDPLLSASNLLKASLISFSDGLLSGGAPLVKSSIIFFTSGNSSLPLPSSSSYFITSSATCLSFASSLIKAYKASFGEPSILIFVKDLLNR